MAKVVFEVVRPPVVLKVLPSASTWKAQFAMPTPKDGEFRPEASKPKEPTPSTSQPSQQVPQQSSKASDTDSGNSSEEVAPPQSLKVRLPLGLSKRSHKTMASSSKNGGMPSKVRKESEAEESETTALIAPSEAALSQARFELYQKDLPKVRDSRAQILRLDNRDEVTQKVLDSSPTFHLRQVADEPFSPAVIGEHWIDYLESEGRIAQCKPNDFKFEGKWLPLYTRAGITEYVFSMSSLINTQGDSPLIAVMPPDMLFQSEREYVTCQLHEADSLSRVTIHYGKSQRKQLAFCPYCRVMNKNDTTAYSHARKHLGITFLCGGCYNKIYCMPQHLVQHRRSCHPCFMNKPESSRQSVRKK